MNTKTKNNISVGYGNHWPSGCVFIAPCSALFYLEDNMQEKKCSKCGEVKDVSEFHKCKGWKSGIHNWCKSCIKIKDSIIYQRNISRTIINPPKKEKLCRKCGVMKPLELFHKDKGASNGRCAYCIECKRPLNSLKSKEWREKYPEKERENSRKYMLKLRSTPTGRLNSNISRAISYSLNGRKSGRHWENLTGYTSEQLKKHLEKQFKPGMNWSNYGQWHIDHIIPLSAHNFQSPEDMDFKRAWALKNLQPLWAKDNILKSDKLTKPFQPALTI